MRTVTKLWERFYTTLGEINSEYPRKNLVIRGTMAAEKIYRRRAARIIESIDDQKSILEIGCGFGGIAREILKKISISYTVVDNKIMLIQAKKFLGDRVEYIDAKQIEVLKDRKFGFFISHYCLAETPPEYRKYILENIIKNCQKISVIDINDEYTHCPKMLKSGLELFPLEIEKWIRKYFIIKKTVAGRKQSMYVGERLK